jgi:hypothetical protein
VSIERIPRPELFFGVVGPVGVDLDMIIDVLTTELNRQKYSSEVVRVTQLMKVVPSNIEIRDDNYLDRITSRIAYANDVCSSLKRQDALAAIIPSAVQTIRDEWRKQWKDGVACTRFRRHRVRCFDGAGGGSWRGVSLRGSSSLRRCA